MLRAKNIFPVIVCSFIYVLCYSQQFNLQFKNITSENGLSENSITDIIQDSLGFMWFATVNGLNKFDGINTEVFHSNPLDSSAIPHDDLLSLCTYGDELFIGSIYPTMAFAYSIKTKTFRTLLEREESRDEETIKFLKNDNFLLLATSSNLYLYNVREKKFDTYDALAEVFNNIQTATTGLDESISVFNNNFVNAYHLNKENILTCFIYGIGILEISLDDLEYNIILNEERINETLHISEELEDRAQSYIYRDARNRIWYNYNEEALAYITPKTKTFHIELPQIVINDIFEDEDYIWFSSDSGLYLYNDKNVLSKFTKDDLNPNSLSNNKISKTYINKQGVMWVGHVEGGVDYTRYYNIKEFKYLNKQSKNNGLLSNNITGIAEGNNGQIWISSDEGVNMFDMNKNIVKTYLKNEFVISIFCDSRGNVWCFNTTKNVLLKRKDKSDFEYINLMIDDRYELEADYPYIFEDSQKRLWLIEAGLYEIDLKNLSLIKYDFFPELDYAFSVSEDASGNFWIAGNNNMLLRINPYNKTSDVFTHDLDNPYTITNDILWDVCIDIQENIWIGTNGGLSKANIRNYTGGKLKFETVKINDKLADNIVFRVFADDNKAIWLATENGISKLALNESININPSLKKNNIVNYNIFDGIAGKKVGMYDDGDDIFLSGIKVSNGDIILGSNNGITFFNPDNLEGNKLKPKVIFTNLKINNKIVQINELVNNQKVLKQSIETTEFITLSYVDRIFSFEFIALDFADPKRNQYAYKLEGFDDSWNFIENKREVPLANLPGGEYELKIKATNTEGAWNSQEASIKLKIVPPFWKTWWFRIFIALLLLACTLIYIRYRTYSINKRNEELKALVQKRTAELKIANQAKLQFFTNISHELRTPLTLIKGPLDNILSNKPDEETLNKQLSMMRRNTNRLLRLINQLLDFRKVDTGYLKLQVSKSNIVSFIFELYKSFTGLANQRNIAYNFTSSVESLEVFFDDDIIEKIVFNLLSNAFNYSPDNAGINVQLSLVGTLAGTISEQSSIISHQSLENSAGNSFFQIVVSDTGLGISDDKIDEIFKRFYRTKESSIKPINGSGIGLALTKSLVKLHKGTISVKSKTAENSQLNNQIYSNSGTTFTITLPIGKDHYTEDEIVQEPIFTDRKLTRLPLLEKITDNKESINTQAQTNSNSDNQAPKILVVDDNPDVREYIVDLLQKDYQTEVAQNGNIAIKKTQEVNYDLIISDIMMPEMDGNEFCRLIKTNIDTSHIPVILLTAKASVESEIIGLETGGDDYISKPFNQQVLLSKIRNHIESRKKLKEKFNIIEIPHPRELTVNSLDQKFIEKVLSTIEANLTDSSFNIEKFSQTIGVSHTQLYKKLKSLTGYKPNEFIVEIRLKRAAQLIKSSDLQIAEIAYKTGFADPGYFSKIFKKKFGILPSEFRK